MLQKAMLSLFGTFSRQLLCVLRRPSKNNLKYVLKYPLFNFNPNDLFTVTPSSLQHSLVEAIKNTLTLETSLNPRRLCSRNMENLHPSLIKWQIAKGQQEPRALVFSYSDCLKAHIAWYKHSCAVYQVSSLTVNQFCPR